MATKVICDECGRPLGDDPCAVAEPVVVKSRTGSGLQIRLAVEGGEGMNLHASCARRIIETGDLMGSTETISLTRKRRAS